MLPVVFREISGTFPVSSESYFIFYSIQSVFSEGSGIKLLVRTRARNNGFETVLMKNHNVLRFGILDEQSKFWTNSSTTTLEN